MLTDRIDSDNVGLPGAGCGAARAAPAAIEALSALPLSTARAAARARRAVQRLAIQNAWYVTTAASTPARVTPATSAVR